MRWRGKRTRLCIRKRMHHSGLTAPVPWCRGRVPGGAGRTRGPSRRGIANLEHGSIDGLKLDDSLLDEQAMAHLQVSHSASVGMSNRYSPRM
jgi:hypothetical protein